MPRRQKVTVQVSRDGKVENVGGFLEYGYPITFDFDYSNLDDIIKELNEAKDTYGSEYDSLQLREQDTSSMYESSPYYQLVLFGTRDENDVERKHRLDHEKAAKEFQEEEERRIYEELKAEKTNCRASTGKS